MSIERACDLDTKKAYYRVLKRDRNNAYAWTNLGNLLQAENKYNFAIYAYKRAMRIDAHVIEATYNLGYVYMQWLSRYEDAIPLFERALLANPDFLDARYNLAFALRMVGRTAESRKHFGAYLRADSTSHWAEQARAYIGLRRVV